MIGDRQVNEVQRKHGGSIYNRMGIKENALKQSLKELVRVNLVIKTRKRYIISKKNVKRSYKSVKHVNRFTNLQAFFILGGKDVLNQFW